MIRMIQMTEQTDSSLVQQYAQARSQEAFAELVSRHSDWVYSAALRQVRDKHLAEDVTQAVFLLLADKAPTLSHISVHGWLFKVTRYASANAVRARSRRDKYERRAAQMIDPSTPTDSDSLWNDVAPALDEAIERLRTIDRDALLLRFYQRKSMVEVGISLGISEDAAKKRVATAVDRLRDLLGRRGVVTPALILSTALFTHTTHAAPVTLALSVTTASASTGAATIAKGAATMLFTAKLKAIAAAILVIALLPTGIGAILLAAPHLGTTPPPVAKAPAVAPLVISAPTPDEPQLDPRIAQFVNSQTDLLVSVNLDMIDVDALQGDFQNVLIDSNLDPKALTQITQSVQAAADSLKPLLAKFKTAGVHEVYIPLNLAATIQGNTPPLIFPLDNAVDHQPLENLLKSYLPPANSSGLPPRVTVSSIDQVVLLAAPGTLEQLKTMKPEPRPELAAAMAAGSGAIHAVYAPLQLMKSPVMAMVGAQAAFNDPQWQNVLWGSISVSLPPSDPAGIFETYKCKDAASAQALVKLSNQHLAKATTNPAATFVGGMDVSKLMANIKITTDGDTIHDTIELKPFEDFILRTIVSLKLVSAAKH